MRNNKTSDYILAIVTALFIFTTAVLLTLQFRALYFHDMDALKIPETSGYDSDVIIENYDELINYNMSPGHKELALTLPMSEEGRTHFAEVKAIFQAILYIFWGSALILSVGSVWKNQRKEYNYLLLGGITTSVVTLALCVMVMSGWESFFTAFHHVMFRNDFWLFDPATDPIINMLPDAFFMHCAIMIFLVIFILSVGSVIIWKRKTSPTVKTRGKDGKTAAGHKSKRI